MASSSSGLGRRPLKAEIVGSNPIEATKFSACNFGCRLFYFTYPTNLNHRNSALGPFCSWSHSESYPELPTWVSDRLAEYAFVPMAHFSHSPTSLDFPTMHTPRPSHPAHGAAKKPSTGDRKQKFDSNCNFFAIGNCCEPSDRRSRYKTAGNPPLSGRFRFARLKNEPLIAKKLQKERDFCFHNGQIATTGTRPYEKRVKSPSKGKRASPAQKKARRQNHTSQLD